MPTPVGPADPDPDDPEQWDEWDEADNDDDELGPGFGWPIRIVALFVVVGFLLLVILAA
jgi:hypothetical protein